MNTLLVSITSLILLMTCFSANAQTPEKELFPPIDIKTWDQTSCVSGRLATKAETQNGTALLYYDEKEDAKPYNMNLPKLAYVPRTKIGWEHLSDNQPEVETEEELVVVIQIVETSNDTMVGYRPLTGGNGASAFRDFRFLTEEEVERLTGK